MDSFRTLLPYNWNTRNSTSNTPQLVELDAESDEYKHAKKVFAKEYGSKKIRKIERIENRHAYLSAMIEKERMIFVHKANPEETQQLRGICHACKDYFIKHPNEITAGRKHCPVASRHVDFILFNGIHINCGKTYLYPVYHIMTSAEDAGVEHYLSYLLRTFKGLDI